MSSLRVPAAEERERREAKTVSGRRVDFMATVRD